MEKLRAKFYEMQEMYGDPNLNAIFGGGCEKNPKVCLVFMNPTARNVSSKKNWTGIRRQWLGTKQVWNFLAKCGLFDETLNDEIQSMSPKDWTPEFCEKVYQQVESENLYITNLAKCTQCDAKPLSDDVFKNYVGLLKEELEIVDPQRVVLFGNQVSSIVLGERISVSTCRRKEFELKTSNKTFKAFVAYYPVGNGFFNADKAIEDLKFVCK